MSNKCGYVYTFSLMKVIFWLVFLRYTLKDVLYISYLNSGGFGVCTWLKDYNISIEVTLFSN